MYDLALNASSHDLALTDAGDLMLIDNAERVAQQIKINLMLIKGEWFLDPGAGVPYLDEIFTKNPNLEHIKSLFRSKILEVEGVESVLSLELSHDVLTRIVKVNYSARTKYGLVTRLEALGYGR